MKIAVLLSGGVDSSTALRGLQEQGFTDITAYYLKIWLEDDSAYLGDCPWEEDLEFASRVCEQAGVELRIVPLQLEYYDKVVEYALAELKAGRTPSPDIFCNQRIKFGAFFGKLEQFSLPDAGNAAAATDVPDSRWKVASGHYARIDWTDETFPGASGPAGGSRGVATILPPTDPGAGKGSGRWRLLRAPDPVKDQTYFLSQLSQAQLGRILFPIGGLHKGEVRELAHRYDLANQDRPDSQGICFLGKIRYPDFVRHYLGEQDGPIIDHESGEELGRHKGFWFHTTGQRAGLGLGNGPWYVAAKDCARNVVYVSHGSHVQEASRSDFQAGEINWLAGRAPTADELAGWNKLGATDWSGAGAMDDAGATSGDRGEADGALPLPSDNAVRLGRTDPAGLCLKLRHGPQLIPCRLEWAKQGSAADGNMSVQGSAAPTDNGCPTSTLRVSMARSDRGLAAGQFAVFYLGEECLGSGKILELDPDELERLWARHVAWRATRDAAEQAVIAAKRAKKQSRREKYGRQSTPGTEPGGRS